MGCRVKLVAEQIMVLASGSHACSPPKHVPAHPCHHLHCQESIFALLAIILDHSSRWRGWIDASCHWVYLWEERPDGDDNVEHLQSWHLSFDLAGMTPRQPSHLPPPPPGLPRKAARCHKSNSGVTLWSTALEQDRQDATAATAPPPLALLGSAPRPLRPALLSPPSCTSGPA